MTSPAEMKLCGTVAAIFSGLLNEIKTIDGISEVVFEPSKNTGGLDNSAHPVKNYGIPVPFTIFKEGALQKVPPASAEAKLKPSPLTDWGDITIKYTNESMKATLETLITKYPNSIKSFVVTLPTSTATEVVANAPPVAVPAVPAASAATQRLVSRKKNRVRKSVMAVPPVLPAAVSTGSLKDTVAVTDDGVVSPYKVGTRWCQVIIGKGEVGNNGDHLKVCSATEETLKTLVDNHKQTVSSADQYSNCGGLPCNTNGDEDMQSGGRAKM
jgi:hypothetical protein